jgi:hypothetical protein
MTIGDIFFLIPILGLTGLICVAAIKAVLTKPNNPDPDEDCTPIEPEIVSPEFLANQELEDLALDLQEEILEEWDFARNKFGPFNSTHEGFAVLWEEFDELKAEVWKNSKKHPTRDQDMRKEAIQVAAMALRFLTDCCPKKEELRQ